MLKPEPACLAIADITGYTRFLAGTELDHAQDILADLTNTVVTSLRPSLRLAKLEGDAVFVYSLTLEPLVGLCDETLDRPFQLRGRCLLGDPEVRLGELVLDV